MNYLSIRSSHQMGLLCGSYGGIGKAEPLTERMYNRIAPMLAIYFPFARLKPSPFRRTDLSQILQ
ncbi:MAG: hypothetical protein QM500_19380 [Methylococcales bacterium]